jgi:hypothetical protein
VSLRVHIALPVALALFCAVGGAITWWWWREIRATPTLRDMQPVLDRGQRSALPTYKRKCRTQGDCEKPLLCMDDPRVRGWRCLASECESDYQCEPGLACTPVIHTKALAIRVCLIKGVRKEGEGCEDLHLKEQWGCAPGLICERGYCGRSCDPGEPSACPEGFFCRGDTRWPTCLPSCLRSGCPQEKQCVRIDGELSICATVHGQDCDKQPCPTGTECQRLSSNNWRSPVVSMWCAPPCNEEEGRPCPAGSACIDNHYCARLCDEEASEACAAGERCERLFMPGKTFTACVISP